MIVTKYHHYTNKELILLAQNEATSELEKELLKRLIKYHDRKMHDD